MRNNQYSNTNSQTNQEGVYSFSVTNSQQILSTYLDKVAWVVILAIFGYAFLIIKNLSMYSTILFLLLCAGPFFFGRIQHKFARKIILDFSEHKVLFHMYRREPIIEMLFDDINEIHINGYIRFVIKGQRIYYSDLNNHELLRYLNKISKISWGYMCNIWGPKKEFRDELAVDKKQ